MPTILDGKKVRDDIQVRLKSAVEALSGDLGKKGKVTLAIIQVGQNPESTAYIGQKKKFAEAIGAAVDHLAFDESVSQAEIMAQIQKLNKDKGTHGILVQMPLPFGLDKNAIIEGIDPSKDVDGLTSVNIKKLWANQPDGFLPATAKAVMTLLDHYRIPLEGKRAVVVGRSELVGKPVFLSLINQNATVTLCHSRTENLSEITKAADILVVAAGKPNFITADFVSVGQTVIDVGINVKENDGIRKLIGDVDIEAVKEALGPEGAISPVPGGVGPLTVASLFENLVRATVKKV